MTKATMAIHFVQAMALKQWPDDAKNMETHCLDWLVSILDYTSAGTHKYIPTEALNRHFKLPDGAGVYGYVKFEDDSYVLRTCNHGVIEWDATKLKLIDGEMKIVVDA